ncbi:hypothetical protein [Methylobacterium gregans]|uniref:hypothetical protein n=1 Tax=Methylobacterium gregans TaxID=374424 RepID=UPI003616E894
MSCHHPIVARFAALGALALGLVGAAPMARAETLPAINLQLTPWTVVARQKGFFKEAFEPVGTKQVNLIASGAAELLGAEAAAVGGGAIAIAQRMIYPATVHRANGLDGVVIWASEPSNRYRAPILARADNDAIKTVADLDGKTFGSSRISCYWSSPFEILEKAGLPSIPARSRAGCATPRSTTRRWRSRPCSQARLTPPRHIWPPAPSRVRGSPADSRSSAARRTTASTSTMRAA